MGIDYGLGKTNIDKKTGIRYGVISSNKLSPYALDDIYTHGIDQAFEAYRDEVRDELASAIARILQDHCIRGDEEEFANEIIDNLEFDNYENDNSSYRYDTDEVFLELHSDGDIFVTHSEFYTLCDYCSPCAPGAGYLTSPGEVRAYCLGPDWFDSDNPMPYRCFRLSDNSEVFAE